jgi:hypothetical protein
VGSVGEYGSLAGPYALLFVRFLRKMSELTLLVFIEPYQLEEGQTSQTFNRSSPISPTNARGKAENELLSLNIPHNSQVVLNLAGLWGGERNPRNWVGKVLPTKEALRKKGGLHMSKFPVFLLLGT